MKTCEECKNFIKPNRCKLYCKHTSEGMKEFSICSYFKKKKKYTKKDLRNCLNCKNFYLANGIQLYCDSTNSALRFGIMTLECAFWKYGGSNE